MASRKAKNTTGDQNSERVVQDMAQARAMRGERLSYHAPGRSTRNLNKSDRNDNDRDKGDDGSNSIQKDIVETAFKNLDHAEVLARGNRKDMEEALSVYGSSIEVLIQVLNALKNKDASSSSQEVVNRDVLAERVRAALTDAESLKESLRLEQQQQQQHQQKGERLQLEKTKKSSYFSSLFGSTTTKKQPKQEEKIQQPQQQQRPPQRRPLYQQHKSSRQFSTARLPAGEAIKKSKSDDADQNTSSRKPDQSQSKQILQKQQHQQEHKPNRSNLNYNTKDPFIETIKSDMYVDSSTLTTTWNDISGLSVAKQSLQEAAILPLLRPDLYTGLRSPPRGILLYGPPGTGKTMLVKAVAHESQCLLFACSASAMTSKWVGEGEKLVRTLFRMALDVAPSIIFLDEMDALLGRRKSDGNSEGESSRRFKTEFMVQMEGIAAGSGSSGDVEIKKTLVIGCTNCPWDIDDAVMRRFQRRIYVPLPDTEARSALWKHMVRKANKGGESKKNVALTSRQLSQLVNISEGFSCSDIQSIANEASFGPLRDLGCIEAIKAVESTNVRPVEYKDFAEAIKNSKRSVSNELLRQYDEWERSQAARN